MRRRKSAYASAHHPAYERATHGWVWDIVSNANAPIHPLLSPDVNCALEDGEVVGPPGLTRVSLSERIIQLNAWLDTYHVTLAI